MLRKQEDSTPRRTPKYFRRRKLIPTGEIFIFQISKLLYLFEKFHDLKFRFREPVSATKTTTIFPKADTAFKALLSARFCAAIWTHLADCDEVFNYWEPLHYLIYGNGLQTWEYSPQFALRSYTYLLIQGVPAWCYEQIFHPNPMLVFYFVRCMLGLLCAVVEVYFYKGVCREFGVHIGRLWLIFQLFSAGMFISSTALLPSSFSMYFCCAALTAWWHQKYKLAIFFTAISTLLGKASTK
jgi:alpha-1,2-mannosyltransferase